METRHCLNCHEEITKKFCANCGQKSDTHRITFKHFIAHDLIHGTFHLDRGILFTIQEAMKRPGQAALDYIGGKRIRYYNVFYLSLILIGLAILSSHTGNNVGMKGGNDESNEYIEFFTNNIKFILLGFVPLLALNARLLFWKTKLNIAEHFIMAGFTFVGVLVMTNILLISDTIVNAINGGTFFQWILVILTFTMLLFPAWAYANLGWKFHSFLGLLWRMIVFYVLLLFEIICLLGLSIWLVTGQSGLVIH